MEEIKYKREGFSINVVDSGEINHPHLVAYWFSILCRLIPSGRDSVRLISVLFAVWIPGAAFYFPFHLLTVNSIFFGDVFFIDSKRHFRWSVKCEMRTFFKMWLSTVKFPIFCPISSMNMYIGRQLPSRGTLFFTPISCGPLIGIS